MILVTCWELYGIIFCPPPHPTYELRKEIESLPIILLCKFSENGVISCVL